MKHILPFLLLLAACSDPTTSADRTVPCSGYCEGLDISIDSTRVVLPSVGSDGKPVAFSGDTIHFLVYITNRGTVATDSFTSIKVESFRNRDWSSAAAGIVPPGKSVAYDVAVGLPIFARTNVTRDSMLVEVARWGLAVPNYYDFIAERYTPSYALAPTTFELLNVPTKFYYPSNITAQAIIRNPSPRSIPADTLTICLHDIDYCPNRYFDKVLFPTIAPRQTVTIDLPLKSRFGPDDDLVWDQWPGIDLRICYAMDRPEMVCWFKDVDRLPNFEAICAVRQLEYGVPLTSQAGRCGTGRLATTDVFSFETDGSRDVLVSRSTNNGGMSVYSADGRGQKSIYFGGVSRYPLPAGRYYIVVADIIGNGSTVRIDKAS